MRRMMPKGGEGGTRVPGDRGKERRVRFCGLRLLLFYDTIEMSL